MISGNPHQMQALALFEVACVKLSNLTMVSVIGW
jgi:hypothetical protein